MDFSENSKGSIALSWMPDGNGGFQPTPDILTAQEAVRFLRLDTPDLKDPIETLRRYRRVGKLRAVQLGKRVRFRLRDIEEFVEDQMKRNPR